MVKLMCMIRMCAALLGAVLLFSQVGLAAQTPPHTPLPSPRAELPALPEPPYVPFISAVISGNAVALEELLRDLPKEVVQLLFERVYQANVVGFNIHGSAIFFMMRLCRHDVLKVYLDYIERHPELAQIGFRQDALGGGPLHWLLENRAAAAMIVQVGNGDVPFIVPGVPLHLRRPSVEESEKRERIVTLFLAYLERHPEHNHFFARLNEENHTALHVAVHSGWIEVVRQLLRSRLVSSLLVNIRDVQFAHLETELARDIWTEILIVRPVLFGLHDQDFQLAVVTAGVRAIVGRNFEGVRNLLQAGDLRIDARLLYAMWERVDADTDFYPFMEQLSALDWREHEQVFDEIMSAWNRRLRPHLFNGHVLNVPAVLATVLALQLYGTSAKF